jgi:hypothetical protein
MERRGFIRHDERMDADWCEGLGARPRDVRVAEVVED